MGVCVYRHLIEVFIIRTYSTETTILVMHHFYVVDTTSSFSEHPHHPRDFANDQCVQ